MELTRRGEKHRMTITKNKQTKYKTWRDSTLYCIEEETKFGLLYVLRKYVLECMPPDRLRDLLRPKLSCILNMESVNSVRLVSYIDDLILSDMSKEDIRSWITNNIQDEELRELRDNYV